MGWYPDKLGVEPAGLDSKWNLLAKTFLPDPSRLAAFHKATGMHIPHRFFLSNPATNSGLETVLQKARKPKQTTGRDM